MLSFLLLALDTKMGCDDDVISISIEDMVSSVFRAICFQRGTCVGGSSLISCFDTGVVYTTLNNQHSGLSIPLSQLSAKLKAWRSAEYID